jgi:hypothetical protein
VLYDGPSASNGEMFDVVAKGGITGLVHQDLMDKLPWFKGTEQ